MSNGQVGPPNKFTNSVELKGSTDTNLAALNAAWAAYFETYHQYPTVWLAVGTTVYYGGYEK